MATTLPCAPPAFDKDDAAGTVKALCAYARTLQENLDFALGQMQKSMAAIQGNVNTMATGYAKLEARVAALEQNT